MRRTLLTLAVLAAACGGNAAMQTEDCKKWVACSDADLANIDVSYGPNGTCWKDATTAMHCAAACTAALATYTHPDGGLCP